jgi:RHS repeat-associated protein
LGGGYHFDVEPFLWNGASGGNPVLVRVNKKTARPDASEATSWLSDVVTSYGYGTASYDQGSTYTIGSQQFHNEHDGFAGFDYVIETDSAGFTTKHFFYSYADANGFTQASGDVWRLRGTEWRTERGQSGSPQPSAVVQLTHVLANALTYTCGGCAHRPDWYPYVVETTLTARSEGEGLHATARQYENYASGWEQNEGTWGGTYQVWGSDATYGNVTDEYECPSSTCSATDPTLARHTRSRFNHAAYYNVDVSGNIVGWPTMVAPWFIAQPYETATFDGAGNLVDLSEDARGTSLLGAQPAGDGRLTWTRRVSSVSGNPATYATSDTQLARDGYGQVLTATTYDANGSFTFNSNGGFASNVFGQGNARATTLIWDSIEHADVLSQTNPPERAGVTATVESWTYDDGWGKVKTHTPVGLGAETLGYDTFGRLTDVTRPSDAGATTHFDYTYTSGAIPRLAVRTTSLGTPSPNLITTTLFDGLAREVETRTQLDLVNDKVDATFYDGRDLASAVVNPFLAAHASSYATVPSGTPQETRSYDHARQDLEAVRPDGSRVRTDRLPGSLRTYVTERGAAPTVNVPNGGFEGTPDGNGRPTNWSTAWTYGTVTSATATQYGGGQDSPENLRLFTGAYGVSAAAVPNPSFENGTAPGSSRPANWATAWCNGCGSTAASVTVPDGSFEAGTDAGTGRPLNWTTAWCNGCGTNPPLGTYNWGWFRQQDPAAIHDGAWQARLHTNQDWTYPAGAYSVYGASDHFAVTANTTYAFDLWLRATAAYNVCVCFLDASGHDVGGVQWNPSGNWTFTHYTYGATAPPGATQAYIRFGISTTVDGTSPTGYHSQIVDVDAITLAPGTYNYGWFLQQDPTAIHDGAWQARLHTNQDWTYPAGSYWVFADSDSFGVVGGASYNLGFSMRSTAGTNICVCFLDASGHDAGGVQFTPSGNWTFQTYSDAVQAPQNAVTAYIRFGVGTVADSTSPTGYHSELLDVDAVSLTPTPTALNNTWMYDASDTFAIAGGQSYVLSGAFRFTNNQVDFRIVTVDANNNDVGEFAHPSMLNGLWEWRRYSFPFTSPATAVKAYVRIGTAVSGTASINGNQYVGAYLDVDNVDLTLGPERSGYRQTNVLGSLIKSGRQLTPGTWLEANYINDAAGRRTGATDPSGNTTSWTYDLRGLLLQENDKDRGTWTNLYDAAGRLTTTTDARGDQTVTTYDNLDRPLTRVYQHPNGGGYAASDTISYFYEGDSFQGQGGTTNNRTGRLWATSGSNGWSMEKFDTRGRVVEQDDLIAPDSVANVTTTTYDSADRVATLTYPGGEVITYGYGPNGKATSVSSSVNGALLSGPIYGAFGLPTSVTLGGVTDTVAYDPTMGRLSGLKVGAGTAWNETYAYDTFGGLASVTDLSGNTQSGTEQHDGVGRLTSAIGTRAGDESDGFDGASNLTTWNGAPLSYPATNAAQPHAPTQLGTGTNSYSYFYDANGNLKSEGTALGTRTLTYDDANRLSTIQSALGTTTYQYLDGTAPIRRQGPTPGTPFVDHFASSSTLTNWSSPDSGAWTIANGKLNTPTTSTAATPSTLLWNLPGNVGDGSYEFRFQTGSPAGSGCLVFRYQDANNFYCLQVNATASPPTVSLSKEVAGNLGSPLLWQSYDNTAQTWHSVRVRMVSGKIALWVDGLGQSLASAAAYTDGSPLAPGKVGFKAGGAISFQIVAVEPAPSATGDVAFVGDYYQKDRATGTTITRYAADYGLGETVIAAKSSATGLVIRHPDRLGGTALTVNADGTTDVTLSRPFGTLAQSPERLSNRQLFAGYSIDPVEELYLLSWRWYDPNLAHFVQPDSLVPDPTNPLTLNRYLYGNGDPLDGRDPTGHAIATGDCQDDPGCAPQGDLIAPAHAPRDEPPRGQQACSPDLPCDPIAQLSDDAKAAVANVSSGDALATADGLPVVRPGLVAAADSSTDDAPDPAARAEGQASGAAPEAPTLETEKHHIIPRQILRLLSDDVRKAVQGKQGAPNRWSIPKTLHRDLHQGAGGGEYNQSWLDSLRATRQDIKSLSADSVLQIRDEIVDIFQLGSYQP